MPRKKKSKELIIRVAPKHARLAEKLETMPDDLLLAVLESSGNINMQQMATMLCSEQFDKRSIGEICAMNNIGIKDFAEVYQQYQLAHAKIEQAEHAPAILGTNAEAAIGRKVQCSTCHGEGRVFKYCDFCEGAGAIDDRDCRACKGAKVIDHGVCQTCNGEKWVMQAGDPNAVKGFMESTGLTQKAGINVGVNIQNNQFGGAGSFEDLMRDAERGLKAQVVEVKAE